MTGTMIATLPTSSDASRWSDEEKALIEAAGLVHTDSQTGAKTLAERPVVAAFLQHCARTGLDPIARQIYSIARKSRGQLRWQIQVSIDGARLIAERSGEYEGQTPVQWTADGVTWVDVWLADEYPKAARVGVFRRGFREPLYAVARWDSYAVMEDVWAGGKKTGEQKVSSMWAKMPDLMLGKVAEMLALRKAFPQDLSGLYSSEEMQQAQAPAAAPAEPVRAVSAPAAPPQESIPLAAASEDWVALARDCVDRQQLREVWRRAEAAGELGVPVSEGGPLVRDVISGLSAELPEEAPVWSEPEPEPSEWVDEQVAPVTPIGTAGASEEARIAAFGFDRPDGDDAA